MYFSRAKKQEEKEDRVKKIRNEHIKSKQNLQHVTGCEMKNEFSQRLLKIKINIHPTWPNLQNEYLCVAFSAMRQSGTAA